MAVGDKLKVTRDQLAEFIESHNTIRQFERLFEYINGVVTGTDSTAFPIGFVYIQYPGKESPVDKGWLGTWVNISSEFAGDFFRTEGGDASAFESGEQLDQFQGHRHDISTKENGTVFGDLRPTEGGDGSNTTFGVSDPTTDGVNGTPRTGTETRPVNHTIRLWERTE